MRYLDWVIHMEADSLLSIYLFALKDVFSTYIAWVPRYVWTSRHTRNQAMQVRPSAFSGGFC